MIPFVQRIINSTSNAITSIKPSQIMYGNVINLAENILSPPTLGPSYLDLPLPVQEMIQIQDTLIKRATSLRQTADDHRLNNHELPSSDFAPGTLVLIQYATQPPTREWFGYKEGKTSSCHTYQRISIFHDSGSIRYCSSRLLGILCRGNYHSSRKR